MGRCIRVLVAALALLALCAPIAYATGYPSDDDDDHGAAGNDRPVVTPKSVTKFDDHTATLRAIIDPDPDGDDDDDDRRTADDDDDDDGPTSYYFQYGVATPSGAIAYGFTSSSGTLYGDSTKTVSIQVKGLTAGTTYNFRAVATNGSGTTNGDNRTFKTTGRAPDVGKDPKGSGPEPALGRTVVADVAAGTVLVREKGSDEFYPLTEAEEIPVKSTIDTREGTVVLETARRGGESQAGSFRGGLFQVRQRRSGNGMTGLALRGGDFAACAAAPAARFSRASRSNLTLRRLWGKDKGGRFKTSGRGSIATVRGTSWYTADRCDGTLTRVTEGAVMVRERGTGRSKLLHRGQSFLARVKR